MKSLLFITAVLFSFSSYANFCKVKMVDSLNSNETILTTEEVEDGLFVVHDKGQDWKEAVSVIGTKVVPLHEGVPKDLTVQELKELYPMVNDSQLTWTIINDCSDFEKSLIYFYVIEWFYFG